MAWTTISIDRYPDLSNQTGQQKFLDEKLRKSNLTIVQSQIVHGAYYALVQVNGHQSIMTALIEHVADDFNYRFVDETQGPVVYNCPVRMINRADEPLNATAQQWRQQCIERRNRRRLLTHAREAHQTIVVHWDDGDYQCEYYDGNHAWLHTTKDGFYDRFHVEDIIDAGFDVVA